MRPSTVSFGGAVANVEYIEGDVKLSFNGNEMLLSQARYFWDNHNVIYIRYTVGDNVTIKESADDTITIGCLRDSKSNFLNLLTKLSIYVQEKHIQ